MQLFCRCLLTSLSLFTLIHTHSSLSSFFLLYHHFALFSLSLDSFLLSASLSTLRTDRPSCMVLSIPCLANTSNSKARRLDLRKSPFLRPLTLDQIACIACVKQDDFFRPFIFHNIISDISYRSRAAQFDANMDDPSFPAQPFRGPR